jgi:hypothetical protein
MFGVTMTSTTTIQRATVVIIVAVKDGESLAAIGILTTPSTDHTTAKFRFVHVAAEVATRRIVSFGRPNASHNRAVEKKTRIP